MRPASRISTPRPPSSPGRLVDRAHVDELGHPGVRLGDEHHVGIGRAHLLDDRDDLVRTVAAVAADRVDAQAASAATACSGETPIIVWPRVSNVIVAITGMSGDTRRTPSTAA